MAAALLVAWVAALPALGCGTACLEEVRDLQKLGAEAGGRKLAILLEFAMSDCEYCQFVEDDVLKPMLKSGEYREKVLIRRLQIDQGGSVRNFTGAEAPVRAFAQRYGVRLTPTIVLLDAHGQPLSSPLIGVASRDWYPLQLDQAIDEAVARIHADIGGKGAAGIEEPSGAKPTKNETRETRR